MSVKPHQGRMTVCCVAQLNAAAQFTVSMRWMSPVTCAPGSRVSVPPNMMIDVSCGDIVLPTTAVDARRASPPKQTSSFWRVPRTSTSPPNATTVPVTVPSMVTSPPKAATSSTCAPAGTITSSPNRTMA